MLIIFFRTLILFSVLLIVMRLMGKRQIGEMEPFELVITLVVSELTCIPMSDRNIPITFGIVAVLTMFVVHQLIVIMSKNPKLQGIISGKPVMVIDKTGVNLFALRKMSMQVNDLFQALRVTGHFSFEEVDYGIMETNGQLSVVPKKEPVQVALPIPIIMDGSYSEEDVERNGISKQKVENFLKRYRVKIKDVAFMTVDENNRVVSQFEKGDLFGVNLKGENLFNE